jgi:hypothetical protein
MEIYVILTTKPLKLNGNLIINNNLASTIKVMILKEREYFFKRVTTVVELGGGNCTIFMTY